jgi:hypothetical protein
MGSRKSASAEANASCRLATGYDRELVFEEAEFCARRHGRARLQLSRSAMVISVAPDTPCQCARCDKPADRLTFELGDRTLCRRCARQAAR